jgi:hypothetical protein
MRVTRSLERIDMKNRSITVQGAEVAIATRHEQDYISLTDMVKSFEGGSALIEQWLKNKDTVLFLGVWEQINNPTFNSLEFEGIRNEAGRNSFFLSAKKWIELTGFRNRHHPDAHPAGRQQRQTPQVTPDIDTVVVGGQSGQGAPDKMLTCPGNRNARKYGCPL